MTPATTQALHAHIARHCDTSHALPQRWSCQGQLESLWPLNDLFRPRLSRIGSLPYQHQYAALADEAILAYAAAPNEATWQHLDPGTWRVLLERHQQALAVIAANLFSGNPGITVPDSLPQPARQGFAMIFWLHQMKLPMPVQERLTLQAPPDAAPGSMQQH